MFQPPRNVITIEPQFQAIFREIGLDAQTVWTHPKIVVWRKLDDRENAVLDIELAGGGRARLHVKRYEPARGFTLPADEEVRGAKALAVEGIPTAKLAAFGRMMDRRSFVILQDLAGFTPADKAVAAGTPFQSIGGAIADIVAHLHARGLHHRDLYLCHFMIRAADGQVAVRLIDTARVKRLPGIFTRRRWIVKDLAQFWYSTLSLPISDAERLAWLKRYAEGTKVAGVERLQQAIERKTRAIARHDQRLKISQPQRNVSIPTGPTA